MDRNEVLQGLGRVNTDFIRAASTPEHGTCATLDYHATVINSHKREATCHYKGERGYQPPVAVWVEQDLIVVDQFRDGNVPAGPIEFTISADMTKELRAECKKVLEPTAPPDPDRPRWAMLDDTRYDETVGFRLNILTYNVLSILRHRGLPPEFTNAKVKRLRFALFNALATLTTHARQVFARLGETLVRRTHLRALRRWLRDLRRTCVPAPAG